MRNREKYKIGLIGDGHIASILRQNNDYDDIERVNPEKNYDLIIITRPMFLFINQYPEFENIIKRTETLFIPGNALNKEIFEDKYGKTNIKFSFNTPYLGRSHKWGNTKFCMIDKISIDLSDVFSVKVDYWTKGINLSNVFLHPPILFDYYKKYLGQDKYFYDLDDECTEYFEGYRRELLEVAKEMFPDKIFLDPFEYYESNNAKEFANKIFSTNLNLIKFNEDSKSIFSHRYFLDDVDFKLNYLIKGNKKYKIIYNLVNSMKKGNG